MLVTQYGRRATVVVCALRIGAAAFTGAALITLGRIWGGPYPSESTWAQLAVCIVAAACCAFGEVFTGGRSARQEERHLRTKLLSTHFHNALRLPTGTVPPAQQVTLMTDNAERMTEYRQTYLGATIAALCIPFLALTYVTTIDPILGLGIMAACPLAPLAIAGFLRLFRKVSAASRKERGRLTVHYLDALRNLIPIRLLGAGPRTEARLRAQGETNRRAIMRLLARNQVVIIVLDGAFSLLLICWAVHLISTRLAAGAITPTEGMTTALLLTLTLEPLNQVAGFFYIGMGGKASQRAIARALASQKTTSRHTTSTPHPTEAAISIQNIHHDYGRGAVLRDVSLDIPRGVKVAILGPSGAGKSTLLGLLRGTVPIQSGTIILEGQDVNALFPEAACQLSATVAQSTWLFTGTIADNLRMAKPDATDDELWDALRRAHLADEVSRMPGGLDADVGERGQLISGGQAQRLSLARALLSGRRLLLLDEPTSQVDVASEDAIIKAIAELGSDWAVIVVTHRRSLLRVADAAYELTDGILTPLDLGVSA